MAGVLDLSIIILSFNTRDLLFKCLKSIVEHTRGVAYEIIVVDNASTDGTTEAIGRLKQQGKISLRLIENKKNLGFTQGNNQGMRVAKGRYLLLLNSDAWFLENTAKKVVNFLDRQPDVDLVSCRILNPDGTLQPSAGHFPTLPVVFRMLFLEKFFPGWGIKFSPLNSQEVDWVIGAFMALRPEIFQKTKGLEEKMFMYLEETEWCWRIKKAQGKIFFWPGTKIVHVGGGSAKSKSGPIVGIFEGLVYFYQKYFPSHISFLRILLITKAVVSLTIGIFKKDFELKNTYRLALKAGLK